MVKFNVKAFAILGFLLLVMRADLNFVERMELIFVAQLHTAFPAPDPLPENTVITVAVDEKSIDALGQWPWPRSYYVKLIQKLREAGAKAIAFHIVFADPDRMGEHHDQQLAHEIKKGKVILGWLGEGLSVTDNGEPKTYSDKLVMFNNLFESNINKDIFSFVIKTNAPIRNVDVIEESANGAGLLGMMLGSDGMTREVPLLVNSRLKLQPTFFTEVARVSQGQEQTFLETTSIGLKAVHISGDLVVPTNESGAIVLKYRPYNLKNTVSALDVFEGLIQDNVFKGKVVLLGATAPGIERSQYSPLGEVVPEVFFFSLAIEQVLSGESLLRLHTLKGIEIVILLLISVGLIVVFSRYPSYIILRIFVGLQVGLYGLSTLLFARYDLVFILSLFLFPC
ncbi:MAG: CHASE2 domain-containing protein [Magnetovibrio sp.]|nr:CHASE2 domain-containing protein [Magnetovibrio sp.]